MLIVDCSRLDEYDYTATCAWLRDVPCNCVSVLDGFVGCRDVLMISFLMAFLALCGRK